MKRSAGVTVAAIVLLLGSALALFVTVLDAVVLVWTSSKEPQEVFTRPFLVLVIGCFAFFAGVAAFGILTAIGLLRLKNWARITTIVFAVCISLQSFFGGLFVLVMPFPNVSPDFAQIHTVFNATVIGGCVFLIAIGVWWLVLFTRRSVREQFQPAPPAVAAEFAPPAPAVPLPVVPPPAPRPGRVPVLILVVAILLLAATPGLLITPFMHFPALFFTKVLYGRAADLFYFAYFIVALTLGVGLLRLKRWSLPAAVAFYVFRMSYASLMFFPAIRDPYIAAVLRALPQLFSTPPPPYPFTPQQFARIMDFGGAFGILYALVLIVLLLRARPAFNQAARERASASASPSS